MLAWGGQFQKAATQSRDLRFAFHFTAWLGNQSAAESQTFFYAEILQPHLPRC